MLPIVNNKSLNKYDKTGLNPHLGFTLIEIIVTVTIISIITAVGIASYNSFQKNQEIKTAAAELKNNLRFYQAKALAGEKPTYCDENYITLLGFRIDFETSQYSAYAVCKNDNTGSLITVDQDYKTVYSLSDNITLRIVANYLIFKPVTGGMESPTGPFILQICGHGKIYQFTINKGGDIQDDGITEGSCL